MTPDEYAEEIAYFQWCDEQAGIEHQWQQYALLTALVADAEETAVWQWKRELDALGYVEPPQTPPVVDDDAD